MFVKEDKDDLNLKIVDFGLARDLEDGLDIPITTCGTPEFTSPEVTRMNQLNNTEMKSQVIECGYASHKSDMWSLGVIAYMLVSGGVSPFFCRNSVKLERNILAGEVNMDHPSLVGVSIEAKSFIKSLLVVSPSDRWSSKQCMNHKYEGTIEHS